ncbi:MAG: hypothetical protein IJ682_04410 [Lachnospiraceae bacterium]|nr:hypothetical protein [Lachnospiraceae bacterium]
MKRTKIAIWGGSLGIWTSVRDTINPFVTEIIAFIDSDRNKHGLVFKGIPIIGIDQLNYSEIDYILIAAYSGMNEIIEALESKIEHKKIQPYLSEGLCAYNIGSISSMEWHNTLQLYFQPNRMKKIGESYQELYEEYSAMKPLKSNVQNWFKDKRFIAHACGGYVKDRPLMFSNSKEAFSKTIDLGFELIECDVSMVANREWILAHSFFNLYDAIEQTYNIFSLSGFLMALNKEPQLTCLFDVKWCNHQEFATFIQDMNKMLDEMPFTHMIKSQIVVEVYDEATIKMAFDSGYQMIYTQYRNPYAEEYMKTSVLCGKYSIPAVAFPINKALADKKIHIFTEKNIAYYAFSTDSPDEYSLLRNKGVQGVFTNYLYENKDIG